MNIQRSDLICNGTVAFDINQAERLGGGISAFNTSLEFCGNTTIMGNSAFQCGGMDIESCELIFNGM